MVSPTARTAMAPSSRVKDVAVIGGGNSGIEAALDLAGIVHFGDGVRVPAATEGRPGADRSGDCPRQHHPRSRNAATRQIVAESEGKVDGIEYEDRARPRDPSGRKRWLAYLRTDRAGTQQPGMVADLVETQTAGVRS